MQSAPHESFEYKVVPFDPELLTKSALDKEGRQGWMLVATFPQIVFMKPLSIAPTIHDTFAKRLLTVREAAEYLWTSRSQVYRLVCGRQIGSIKIGKSVRIPREAMEVYIRNQS